MCALEMAISLLSSNSNDTFQLDKWNVKMSGGKAIKPVGYLFGTVKTDLSTIV